MYVHTQSSFLNILANVIGESYLFCCSKSTLLFVVQAEFVNIFFECRP